jgi:hypothetical protein
MKVLGIRENIIIYYKKSYSLIMSMKIRVLALLIGFLFFMSGTILYPQYSSYFAKAQNSSIIQQAYKTYIPTTISKEAQD